MTRQKSHVCDSEKVGRYKIIAAVYISLAVLISVDAKICDQK